MNFSLKICRLLVEEGLPLARLVLYLCLSLSESSFYVSCGLSRFHSAQAVNTLFYCSVTVHCWSPWYIMAVFNVQWKCSTSPLAAGWWAVVHKSWMPHSLARECKSWDSNWRPWSVVMVCGQPKQDIRSLHVQITLGSPVWDFVFRQYEFCRWVKRQPCINLLYKYFLYWTSVNKSVFCFNFM
jgi:hypothetical protein